MSLFCCGERPTELPFLSYQYFDSCSAEEVGVFVPEEFGDRQQELVFIGTSLEQEIRKALDKCLLTDKETESFN
jgi:G3E family GTPase